MDAIKESTKIIVIGAGAVGIAAASRLFQNGFKHVTILEAEGRVGGRIYTKQFGGYLVDLGGQWVHGEEDNSVFDLAWHHGILEKPTEAGRRRVFSSTGSALSEDIGDNLFRFFENLTGSRIPNEHLNRSIGEHYEEKINAYFEEHPEITVNQRKPLEDMLNLFQMSVVAGEDWSVVSSRGIDEYEDCKGHHFINWKNKGFGTIIDILTKKFPDSGQELPIMENIVLNTKVSRINYDTSIVDVITTKGEKYEADHVIVTTSLGVLKSDHDTLFNPPLSKSKIDAIKPKKSWILGICDLLLVEYKPRLMCVWVAGPYARLMEKIPESEIFEQTKGFLRRFLGKTYKISEPTDMLRTQWFTNSNFRGTYTYRSLETERCGATMRQLAEPINNNGKPVVLFAGEATSWDRYASVHGAIDSGWREADRLTQLYTDDATLNRLVYQS